MTFSQLAHRAGVTLAALVCATSVFAQAAAGLAQGVDRLGEVAGMGLMGLGGLISVRSVPRAGSTFTLVLPES